MQLDRVVLLGRTLDEYRRYFALNIPDWRGKKVLDVAGGVSSFTAEASAQGVQAMSADPIYSLSAEEIEPRCAADIKTVFAAVRGLPTYKWDFYKNPENMIELRTRAYQTFLQDFRSEGLKRYIPASLPHLPFADKQFDLVLVSYFLFVYQDHFSFEFHENAVVELLRVGREVRIYPTVTFEAEQSEYFKALPRSQKLKGAFFESVQTDFEFLLNSNSFLRVRPK